MLSRQAGPPSPTNLQDAAAEQTALTELSRHWNGLARHDPMWAVLSDPAKQHNGWNEDEFFATGRAEIAELKRYLVDHLQRESAAAGAGRALDFGSGLGRLSQALAAFYDRVDGIDISQEMVAQATALNRHGGRVVYTQNGSNTLPFDGDTFDLVYSNIVLQHIDRLNALRYIEEFVRVLKPNGVAVFSLPSKGVDSDETVFVSDVGTPGGTLEIRMNTVLRADVLAALDGAGAVVLDVVPYPVAGPRFECFRYAFTKRATSDAT